MPRINAIILAGGQSKRMGENKAFLPLGETTFIKTLIQTLEPITDRIIISGNNNVYSFLGHPVVEDEHKNCGPLAGIYAGLNKTDTNWNLIVSVDSPFINAKLIKELKQHIKTQQVLIAETNERQMPLVGFYHKSCKTSIKSALERGSFKVMTILNELKTERIRIQESYNTLLTNVNTPQDYKENLTTIQVRFFGQLAELTGKQETEIVLPEQSTIQQVKEKIFQVYKGLEYKTYKVALNNTMVNDTDVLTKEAKIDFLPAFAGG